MPDHLHLFLLGTAVDSDQQLAIRFLRKYLNVELREHRLQRDAYDHVLRQDERDRSAFEDALFYIRENPVRAGVAPHWNAWSYAGCMVPGYPNLSPASDTFFETFWRIHHAITDPQKRNQPFDEEPNSSNDTSR